MSPRLIRQLSRIVVDRPEKPPGAKEVLAWLVDNGAVTGSGRAMAFRPDAHARIEALLRVEGIRPHEVTVLEGNATRAEVRRVAAYEKTGGGLVASRRVLVRAAPGQPLLLGSTIQLPPKASMDLDVDSACDLCGHQAIMLIENRECFDRLEDLRFTPEIYSLSPLIVFRGSPYVSAGSKMLLERIGLPVWVFGDHDPAGVAIAAQTIGAVGIVDPPSTMLEAEISRAPNRDRFHFQLAKAMWVASDARPWVSNFWHTVTAARCAIPQEAFLA